MARKYPDTKKALLRKPWDSHATGFRVLYTVLRFSSGMRISVDSKPLSETPIPPLIKEYS